MVGSFIDNYIKSTGMSRNEAANKCGISGASLSRLCNGKQELTVEMVAALTKIGLEPELLLNSDKEYKLQRVKQILNG